MKIDVHSHLIDYVIESGPDYSKVFNEISKVVAFDKVMLMSTEVKHWEALEAIMTTASGTMKTTPSFGIHPWHIQANQEKFSLKAVQKVLAQATQHLQQHPSAIIGEIGIDRFERILSLHSLPCPDEEAMKSQLTLPPDIMDSMPIVQVHVFEQFLELAWRLHRPISVHAVKADNLLICLFQARLARDAMPPALLLHSYSGSKESLERLKRLFSGNKTRLFVSFSKAIHGRLPMEKMQRLMRAAGRDTILLETDLAEPTNMRTHYDWIFDKFCETFQLSTTAAETQLLTNYHAYHVNHDALIKQSV